MKPTSIIFLILSLVLILCGVVCCFIGSANAKNQDVSLYFDSVSESGDSINNYELNKITSLEIDLDECDVNIYNTSEKSHIEFIDFSNKSYDLTVQDGKATIKNSGILSIFTQIKLNETGFGYNGLRSYLAVNKYPESLRKVNIYISNENTLQNINIKLCNGDIGLKDFTCLSDINVTSDTGNISVDNVLCYATFTAGLTNGDMEINSSKINESDLTVAQNGDITVNLTAQHSFILGCKSGFVYLEGEKTLSDYSSVYPLGTVYQNDEAADNADDAQTVFTNNPLILTADVNKGNIYVNSLADSTSPNE